MSGDEAAAGDIEYRCFCIKNVHASLSLTSAKIYLQTTTGNASDAIAFAVEVPTSGDSTGSAQTVGGEGTAPTVNAGNVSNWSTATTKAAGVAINIGSHDANLDASEHVFVWTRRTVAAGAAAVTGETCTLRVEGDSAA